MSTKSVAPPTSLTGKQFEEIVVYQLNRYRASGFGSFHRPGVHAVAQERFSCGRICSNRFADRKRLSSQDVGQCDSDRRKKSKNATIPSEAFAKCKMIDKT